MLAAWDRGWAEAEQAKRRQQATLVAGMSTSPGRGGLLAAIRSRFTALHPAATVQLRQLSWDNPTAGLADGTVDVALAWHHGDTRPLVLDYARASRQAAGP